MTRPSRSRFRPVVALAALGAVALVLPAFATTPTTLTVPPAGSTAQATFSGAVPPGSNPTSECAVPGTSSENTLSVEVPAGTYSTVKTVATFSVRWTPVGAAQASDEVLTVRGPDGKVVGSSDGSTTSETVTAVDPVAGTYTMAVCGYANAQQQPYDGTVTLASTDRASGTPVASANPNVTYLTDGAPAFAPATVVSAHLLGGEPQTTVARPLPGDTQGTVDPKAVFVDWPLSSRAMTGTLNRSQDGGDSFRLIFDPACAVRSRPQCNTGGGGDTENEINPYTGHVLFGDQEVLAQEALATSFDKGDTFPTESSFGGTSAATAVDRQWLAAIDPSILSVAGQRVQGFYAYHVPTAGQYVVAITDRGVPIPQAVPQVPSVSQSGQLRVDSTNGPGRGWIYQPYRTSSYMVATAKASDYATPAGWASKPVGSAATTPDVFPWLSLDSHGNVYAVWVNAGRLFYSYMLIDDAANNPALGGRPGTKWSPEQIITPPGIGSAIFPEVVAGDPGKIAIAFDGTSEYSGKTDGAPPNTRWDTYVATVENALGANGGKLVIRTGKVSHRPVHTGNICTSGTTCAATVPEKDRSLLDLIDLGLDRDGRVGVVFTDNNNALALPDPASDPKAEGPRKSPFVHFAKQVAGTSLLSDTPVSVPVPSGTVTDPAGDATWLNRKDGTLLRTLDTLGLTVGLEGDQLVARMPLASASAAGMTADLATFNSKVPTTAPAERLQYVVRFATDNATVAGGRAGDVFHLSFEQLADGTRRAFGGRIDANDGLTNGTSVLGSGYHTDAGYPVTSAVEGDTLVLKAPAAAYGLAAGQRLLSVTGFTTAGPSEAKEATFAVISRTVDATPPQDVTLLQPAVVTASTTPSVTPSASPSVMPSASPSVTPSGGSAPPASPSASGAPSVSPSASVSSRPSAAPSTAASPSPAGSPTASSPAPAASRCPSRLGVVLDRTSIRPEERATVTVSGLPGTPVQLQAYSRPQTRYRVVRTGSVGPDGTVVFSVRPGTNTRLFASCDVASPAGTGASSVSAVVEVRSVVSLSRSEQTGRRVVLQGRLLPRRGGVLVNLYRQTSSGLVLLEQARSDAGGAYRAVHVFTGAGRHRLVARTTTTVVNGAGASGALPVLVR